MTMSLIPTTSAQRTAQLIDSINVESVNFLRSQMQRAYQLANTPGEQQAIMDAFGTNAAQAVTIYATMRAALASIGQADSLPEPDLAMFTPQADGTVVFTAPPEPPAPSPDPLLSPNP